MASGHWVESSEQDERQYEARALPNGLSVLLISDPATEKASAAIDVRVGHLSDPDAVPGLAHFLEHMLFLGTSKFPDENEYNSYLNQHAGSSNAFTDMESTNFYFDVGAEYLSGALDRFSQFFISPLFNQSATDREMNAVDSEHNKNLQSDHWRFFQLNKALCRSDHPFSKFGSGNLQTLRDMPKKAGIDLREELLSFHERYYSANVMKLVVLGKESIPELGEMVESYFSQIPNKEISPPSFPGTPFGKSELAKRIHVVPVKEMRSVELSFPMREIESLYKEKPARYISHLIGHEGKGSILELLRHKGWANDLAAGENQSCSDWSIFSVSVDLTDEGLKMVDLVVEVIFSYIALLRQSGPQEWVYDETATVAAMSFRFLSKRQPIDYACSLAGSMQLYPEEHILSGPYKIWEYGPDNIDLLMSSITVENMMMTVVSKTFEGSTDKTEPWYGTEYSEQTIRLGLLDSWKKASNESELVGGALSLPERNDMIASDFSIRNADEGIPKDEPRLLIDTSTCRCWYKPDNVFSMPKVNIMALLQSTMATESPEASVLASLWVQILNEHATEFTYLAAMASLHCSFSNARKGIEIHVSGYNHKVSHLVSRILDAVVCLAERLGGSLFDRIKDKVEKQFMHFFYAQPYQHAFYGGDLCLEVSKWTIQDKMEALSNVTMADLLAFSRRLLNRFRLELLVHGNASEEDALAIAGVFVDKLSPAAPFEATLPSLRVVHLEKGSTYVHRFPEFNDDDTNSCLHSIYQIGPVDLKTNAALSFLHHLIKEPAFNELRTNEQLGYIVHTSIKTSGDNIKGLLFLVQSDGYDPIHLDLRVEAFLQSFRAYLVDMADDNFQENITAVVKTFLEKNKNLGEESSKYWDVITIGSYIFKKYQIIGAEVAKLSKELILRFFDKYIASGAPDRRKLCVQVYAKQHLEKMDSSVLTGVTLIGPENVAEFKRSNSLFPLPERVNVEEMKIRGTSEAS